MSEDYRLNNGEVFEGKYRILRELGRGGFGMVYLGFQETMDRQVALKVLRPSAVAQSSSAIERFHREVRIISKLKHPNTVTIHDFGETHDGGLYMVLEYVEGEELKQILKREGPQDDVRAAQFARQIAKSLSEAHEHGVVHRDLKPANVMITKIGAEKDFIKVLDFGVASLLDPNTNDLTSIGLPAGERELIGTPRYMSPEQVRGEMLTGASDIYSLGLILYEMLCGRPAVRGDSTMALITQQISPNPLELPDLQSQHPKMQEIIRIATAKRTSERFQTAAQMSDALEQFVFSQKTGSGNQSGGFEVASYQSQMPSWQGHPVTPSGTFPMNLQGNQFQQGNTFQPQQGTPYPQQGYSQGSGIYQQPQPYQQFQSQPMPAYPQNTSQQRPQFNGNNGPQAPFNQGQGQPTGIQPSQPPAVFDPVDFHPTIERSALDLSQVVPSSLSRELPPVPVEHDSFAVEEEPAISRPVRPELNFEEKAPAVRHFSDPSVYIRMVVVSLFALVFGYIGFISIGALLGAFVDGGIRFVVAILAVPILPFIAGLVEGTRVQDRVRVVEPSLIPISRGIFSASVFCLGAALLIGLVFPNKVVPRLEHQPNWFLTKNDTTFGQANTYLSKKVASLYKFTGSAVGMYDKMEADNVTGRRAMPEPTRSTKDKALPSVPTEKFLRKTRRKTPAPTRPKSNIRRQKSKSITPKTNKDGDYVGW